ncbi:MAG: hypothetical protein UV51_C0007G0021 [Candidatus Woesebacteria bacterium GW2011_GWC1_42_9]|nr:MAG: hypothetical protein UV51_C0007G0021 [Candidatus Woesebacteria bacterium GW2011_GWC1_42_9]
MKLDDELEKQKKLVADLEENQKENQKLLEENPSGGDSPLLLHLHKMVLQLMKFHVVDLDFKIIKQKEKLAEMQMYLNTTAGMNFEKQSRECNLNIELFVAKAEKLVNSTTLAPAIKENLEKMVARHKEEKWDDQEEKNDFYKELKEIVNFLKKNK